MNAAILTEIFGYEITDDDIGTTDIIIFMKSQLKERLAEWDETNEELAKNGKHSEDFILRMIGKRNAYERKIAGRIFELTQERLQELQDFVDIGYRFNTKCYFNGKEYVINGMPYRKENEIKIKIKGYGHELGVSITDVVLACLPIRVFVGKGEIPKCLFEIDQCELVNSVPDNINTLRVITVRKKPGSDFKWHPISWYKFGWC